MMDAATDRLIRRMAFRQAGYLRAEQVQGLITGADLAEALRSGRWTRVEPQLYRVTSYPSTELDDYARLVALTGGVLSHYSAALVHHLPVTVGHPHFVHITVTRRPFVRGHDEIALHTATVPGGDREFRDGIPLTTVTRTVCDLAESGLTKSQLDTVVNRALALVGPAALREVDSPLVSDAVRRLTTAR